jgi:hypothetical protein
VAAANGLPVNGAAPDDDAEGRQLQADMARVAARVQTVARFRALTPEEERRIFDQTAGLRQRLARYMQRRMIDQRPEVVTHGRPASGEAAQRGLERAREALRGRESFRRRRPTCPAANLLGGGAVRCAVEHTTLDPRGDPMSLATFCYGDHTVCPTWRAERDRRTKAPLVEAGAP